MADLHAKLQGRGDGELVPFGEAMKLLGGAAVIGKIPRSSVETVAMLREGLPLIALEILRNALQSTWGELADTLRVPKRTLERRMQVAAKAKRTTKLKEGESERLYRLARVLARAHDVFGDIDRAGHWLRAENRALGGSRPLRMLDTDVGTIAVEDVLTRIEHGVPS
jgi:putative toxin-antitoxin system antitoxin component (TIGR02293 family)